MSVANQKIVKLIERDKWDKDNTYARMHINALQEAMVNLKGESGLKLWLYINKNQDNYQFELSQKACAEWGIKKDSYYQGIKDLIKAKYLVQKEEGSNIYYFSEKPKVSEIQKDIRQEGEISSADNSENQNVSEFQKELEIEEVNGFSEFQNEVSEKPNGFSEFPKSSSEKPYRNITNITNKTVNITGENCYLEWHDSENIWVRVIDEEVINVIERKTKKIQGDILAGSKEQTKVYFNEKTREYYIVFDF